MLLLPTFNASLNPCPVGPASFSPHEKGRYCGQCQRVVQDFTQSLNPAADLAAARAASPDGRVCGSFARAQVAAPALSRRLRWFLLALVLVVGQGLTAQEALAQVRKATPVRSLPLLGDTIAAPAVPAQVYGGLEETYPTFRGGGLKEVVAYIQQQVRWPTIHLRSHVEGRVFVSFTVGTDGKAGNAKIVKSPLPKEFDAEVLRVVQSLAGFTPGTQNGLPVEVSMMVPITFKLK